MTNSKVLNGVSVSNAQRKLVGFQLPDILGDLQKKCILFTPEVLIITHFAVISQGTPYAVFSIINSSPSLAFFRVLQYIGSNTPIFPEENGSGVLVMVILLGGGYSHTAPLNRRHFA